MNGDDLNGKAAALEGELLGKHDAPHGGGPASGDEAGQAPPGPTTGELIAALLRPTFDIMAPAWAVSDGECAMLGESYGAVVDKYFPDFAFGVELTAIMVTLAVFGPRMRRPMKAEKKEPAADAEAIPS
jgi:hypothetical protein